MRPYNDAKKSNRVPVGARIARPRFVQNLLFAQFIDAFLYGKTSPYPGRLMRRFVRKP